MVGSSDYAIAPPFSKWDTNSQARFRFSKAFRPTVGIGTMQWRKNGDINESGIVQRLVQ